MFLNIFSTILARVPYVPPGPPITFNELGYLIEKIAQFVLVTSVILAVIFIVRAGVTWMSAGADTTKVDDAKAQLKSGIIGALIVLGVGVIINTLLAIITRQFFCSFEVSVLPIFRVCLIP